MGAPTTSSHRVPNNNYNYNMLLSQYLSLIPQYIQVFRYDNAIFLAERCVAEFPADASAVYWLAVAYYRSGQVPRARQCLATACASSQQPNLLYLSAQCSYELQEYAPAEEALLKECRFQFKQQQQQATTTTTGTLEDWILQTTVSWK